jgi:hypothetical protein
MDTQAMYERGVADAERGELHPFYYQHYYHYRRGYDRTRRRLRPGLSAGGLGRSRALLTAAVILAFGFGAFAVLRSRAQPVTSAVSTAAVPSSPATVPSPVRTPIFPTATTIPSPTPLVLHVGGAAVIANTQGTPLRARQEPSTKARAVGGFKEGERVRIVEGPVDADGYTWWRLEGESGAGWSAQQSQEGVVWLQPVDG